MDSYGRIDGYGRQSAGAGEPPATYFPVPKREVSGRYGALRRGCKRRRHTYDEIEAIAVELQRMVWADRNAIWPDGPPTDPVAMLNPAIVFELMGFDFGVAEGLGQYYPDGQAVEVAGLLDDSTMDARVSRQFPGDVRNFTAAHELGHALLHDARGLHRDRALDGSTLPPDPVETEANKFASYFLMPAKLLRKRFMRAFGTDCFTLNEDTGFALSRGGIDVSACRTPRQLSRTLASAENYNGVRFQSLATQFQVSRETLAIRFEELGLVPA